LIALYLSGFRLKGASNPQLASPELRLIAFGIFWFFLTLAVESSLIPIADVIFEHRLYLPSVGVAAAVAAALLLAMEKSSAFFRGRLPVMVAVVAIGALAVATWQRNQVWENEVSLWRDVARKSPGKHRPWYNLGTHLMTDSGKPAEAIPPLLRAVALDPQHGDTWHNLGSSYLLTNQYGKAVAPLRTAVRLKPELQNAVVNLAVALIHNRQSAEAVRLLEGVRQRLPEWPEARLNLGIAYAHTGRLAEARGELAVLQRIAPHHAPNLMEQIRRAGASPSAGQM
jgi:cytochrome c-type biogenesis protein CcmH/NrfG